jgi:predicted RecA/RadA family phage recombinase
MANLTLAQMLALLADNNSGQISAADIQAVVQALFERTDGTNPIPALLFDVNGASGGAEGHVHWNNTVNTLAFDVSATGSLDIGKELWMDGRNTTGSTILDGRPVRITGGQGSNTLVSLDNGQGQVIGVATEDIPNNSTGRVTTYGVVHDLNTTAFNDGDRLYATATGTLTTSLTASFVGVVLNSNVSAGEILVFPQSKDTLDGTTANRPLAAGIGTSYFDTTLGIPVWWNGSVWKNASGATV